MGFLFSVVDAVILSVHDPSFTTQITGIVKSGGQIALFWFISTDVVSV